MSFSSLLGDEQTEGTMRHRATDAFGKSLQVLQELEPHRRHDASLIEQTSSSSPDSVKFFFTREDHCSEFSTVSYCDSRTHSCLAALASDIL